MRNLDHLVYLKEQLPLQLDILINRLENVDDENKLSFSKKVSSALDEVALLELIVEVRKL